MEEEAWPPLQLDGESKRAVSTTPPSERTKHPSFCFVFRVIRAFLSPVRDGWKDAAETDGVL